MQVFIWLQFLCAIAENGLIYLYWVCAAPATSKLKVQQARAAKNHINYFHLIGYLFRRSLVVIRMRPVPGFACLLGVVFLFIFLKYCVALPFAV